MYVSSIFPLWQSTFDGRRICALGFMRPFPLPLLAMPAEIEGSYKPRGHETSEHVGKIRGASFIVDGTASTVLLTCDVDDLFDVEQWRGWYIGPDLDSVVVYPTQATSTGLPGPVRLTGNLIGATLQREPCWPGQQPITIHDEESK